MRFKEFLVESDVTGLTKKAYKKTIDVVNSAIKDFLKEHASKDMFDDDNFQKYLDKLKPKFLRLTVGILYKLEAAYEQLATEEVESRFGKITKFKDIKSGHADAAWDKMWWIGTIKVLIDDKEGLKKQSSGYFQSSSREVRKDFPARKTEGLDEFNDPVTGIQIAIDVEWFSNFLKDIVIDTLASTGEPYFDIEYGKDHLDLLINMVDTFSHEVTHLLQYTKSSLTTHKRNVANFDVYAKKNYLPQRIQKRIDGVLDADSNKWTGEQWALYLSRAIEIDAHAVSVASKIISVCDDKNPRDELYNLECFIEDLKSGFMESKSFNLYTNVIKPWINKNPNCAKVWKRFMKKISTQILTRIEAVKKEIKSQED